MALPEGINPNKTYAIKGDTLQTLIRAAKPTGAKNQITVRLDASGQVSISFANVERFKCVRNGVIKTALIPAHFE